MPGPLNECMEVRLALSAVYVRERLGHRVQEAWCLDHAWPGDEYGRGMFIFHAWFCFSLLIISIASFSVAMGAGSLVA